MNTKQTVNIMHNKYHTILIKSWKKYHAKQLNIIKESLHLIRQRLENPRDYTAWSPIAFDVLSDDNGEVIYLVHLTEKQCVMWRISEFDLCESDIKSINFKA
jgi:hypothetical protein